uniref:Putative secreted protein n=1 Tax=Ixodes ricinus TaxID=34613 RepID=A0A6B0VA53_IXORI
MLSCLRKANIGFGRSRCWSVLLGLWSAALCSGGRPRGLLGVGPRGCGLLAGHLSDGRQRLVQPGVLGGVQLRRGAAQLVRQVLVPALGLNQCQLGLRQLELQLAQLRPWVVAVVVRGPRVGPPTVPAGSEGAPFPDPLDQGCAALTRLRPQGPQGLLVPTLLTLQLLAQLAADLFVLCKDGCLALCFCFCTLKLSAAHLLHLHHLGVEALLLFFQLRQRGSSCLQFLAQGIRPIFCRVEVSAQLDLAGHQLVRQFIVLTLQPQVALHQALLLFLKHLDGILHLSLLLLVHLVLPFIALQLLHLDGHCGVQQCLGRFLRPVLLGHSHPEVLEHSFKV